MNIPRSVDEAELPARAIYQNIGLVVGPLVALCVALLFKPENMGQAGVLTAALALWMAIWWATEAIPVAVTALLPLVLLPLTGVLGFDATASRYAHWIIWLYFGGFIMALTIERWGLHKRMALGIFRVMGTSARALVGGFMVAAAFLSMWISNTSTAMMLLPMTLSVIAVISQTRPDMGVTERRNFAICMLLGLAYGATIGGMSTLVGTPPNALMAAFVSETYGIEISFFKWMMVGVPLMLVFLPITWLLLTRVIYPVNFKADAGASAHLFELRRGLGRMGQAERRTAMVFAALVAAWLGRGWLSQLPGLGALTDSIIAVTAAIALMIIPSGTAKRPLLTWDEAVKLPWGVLILFGGGLALAKAFEVSGLAVWLGQSLAGLGSVNIALLVLAATLMVIFLTELTSNLATAAAFLPVIGAIAVESGQDPLVFIVPVTLAASCAFMLPVATPPNAIVFGSGQVSIPQMIRAGFVMNLVGVLLLCVIALALAPAVFGQS